MRAHSFINKPLIIAAFSFIAAACACNGQSQTTGPQVNPGIANATSDTLTESGCMRTGCSSHICTEQGEPIVSTCQWREEYACYKTARCEKQTNGKCGWSESSELSSCLKAATGQQQGLQLKAK